MSRVLALLPLALWACKDAPPKDDTGEETGGDTSLPDCSFDATGAMVGDAPSTAELSWSGAPEGALVVEVSDASGLRRDVPVSGSSARISFLPAGVTSTLLVGQKVDGSWTCASNPVRLEAPPAPADLPALVTTVPGTNTSDELLFTTFQGFSGGAVGLDRQGRYAWWRVAPTNTSSDRVRLAEDGTGVWLLERDIGGQDGEVRLMKLDWAGQVVEELPAPLAHHDFVEIGSGGDRIAYLRAERRFMADLGMEVVGDVVVVVEDDGSTRDIFNAFDSFEVVENAGWEESTYAGGADWTHANSITWWPEQDAFLVSLHFPHVVLLVGRTDGLRAVFGSGPGMDGDFAFTGAEPSQLHSPVLTPEGGLTIFENGDTTRRESFVVEYDVDWDARTAVRGREWSPAEGTYAYIMGDGTLREDGTVLSSWGNLGFIAEFDPSGEVAWKVSLPMGNLFTFLSTRPPTE